MNIETAESFAEVPGGRVYLKAWGPVSPVSAIPLILLHDSIGCVEMWRDFPEKICRKLRRPVIAYDRLGFGKSSARQGLPSVHFVEEEGSIYFPKVHEKIGGGKFDLFGHSVGGGMAVAIAAHLPEFCRAVVTEASQAFVEERTLEGIRRAKAEFADPRRLEKLTKFHGEKAKWALDAWVERWLSPEFADWSLADLLPKVRCPLLAIHGDKDEYGSLAFPEMIAKLSRGRAFLLEGCGHMPHREREREVLGEVSRFFRGA